MPPISTHRLRLDDRFFAEAGAEPAAGHDGFRRRLLRTGDGRAGSGRVSLRSPDRMRPIRSPPPARPAVCVGLHGSTGRPHPGRRQTQGRQQDDRPGDWLRHAKAARGRLFPNAVAHALGAT